MNHYEVLNVKPTASQNEIKKAYRMLAKKYHPDTYKGDKSFAEDKMQEINRAYDVLSNPDLRKSYDLSEGIFKEELITTYQTSNYYETRKRPNEANPYKTYNDMRNVRYHQNRTGTYYDPNGYARANYTPYNEEEYFHKKRKDKFISFNEFISSKKWIFALLMVLGGVIGVAIFLNLAMKSFENSLGGLKTFEDFFRYFN